jgi:hypothetical protein
MCQTPSCASMAGMPHVNSQPTVLHSHPGPTSHAASSPLQMPHTGLQGARQLRQIPSMHLMHSGLYLHAMHDPAQAAHAAAQTVAGGHCGLFSDDALHLAQCGSQDALHGFRTGSQSAMQGSLLHLAHPMHATCTTTRWRKMRGGSFSTIRSMHKFN